MDELINIINEIHDVLKQNKITAKEIQLPRFVVVGEQSSGKSTCLEFLVRKEFFPTGDDMVTRAPLELRLVYLAAGDEKRLKEGDYAIFEHQNDKVLTDFNDVKNEIENYSQKLTNNKRDISEKPICLTIYSDKVVNLTLVDLPGLVNNPTPDQPTDIEEKIERLVRKYICEEKTLILVVAKANNELQTCQALKLARKEDPTGNRTLVVLTHVDRVEEQYYLESMLLGNKIPVKKGIVGVRLRSKKEKTAKKSIEDCIKIEQNFWDKYPDHLKKKNGIKYLSFRLNQLLMNHIRDNLPQLRQLIQDRIDETKAEVDDFEETVIDGDKIQLCNKILKEFCANFKLELGSEEDDIDEEIKDNELNGGARIHHAIQEIFVHALEDIVSIDMPANQILNKISNITGYYDPITYADSAYRKLATSSIKRLKDECLNCNQMIYGELLNVVEECYRKLRMKRQYVRFPNLCDKIHDVATNLIKVQHTESIKFLEELVYIMSRYVNKDMPGFMNDELKKFMNAPLKTEDPFVKNFIRQLKLTSLSVIGDKKAFKDNKLTYTMETTANNDINDSMAQNTQSKSYVVEEYNAEMDRLNGSYAESNNSSHIDLDEVMPNAINNNNAAVGTLQVQDTGVKEKKHIDVILTVGLVNAYFKIVKQNLQDLVPKAIMKLLVIYVKTHLYDKLQHTLMYEGEYENAHDNVDYLLTEDRFMVQLRQEKEKALEGYTEALKVFNKLREYQLESLTDDPVNSLNQNNDGKNIKRKKSVESNHSEPFSDTSNAIQ